MRDDLTTNVRNALRSGDAPAARRMVRQALEANPQDPEAWALSSLLTDDLQQQARVLRHALRLDPNQRLAQLALAHVEQKLSAVTVRPLEVPAPAQPAPPAAPQILLPLETPPPSPAAALPIIDSRRRMPLWPMLLIGTGVGMLLAAAFILWLELVS